MLAESRSMLDDFVLKTVINPEKNRRGKDFVEFHVNLRELDELGYEPTEDPEGRFYFEISIENKLIRFYQFDDVCKFLSGGKLAKVQIFKPIQRRYSNYELDIINNY